ncbi:MAG: transposon-transfer assisting family protein [Clostridiales bacterium]|nr:transposon-transfer assisting family protein [Clostridiales bacterium]
MQLTVKEMELLCIFHAGSKSATLEALQGAASAGQADPRIANINSLVGKLSKMQENITAYITFESA